MTEPPNGPTNPAILAALRSRLSLPELEFARPPEPVTGGFETRIYSLSLSGAPEQLSGDLILRLYPGTTHARNALVEFDVYALLADAGIPAPRAHHVCDDVSLLGGAWLLMDLVPGKAFIRAIGAPRMLFRAGPIMAEVHARLHAIDPAPLAAKHPDLAARGLPRTADLRERAERYGAADLLPAIDWLEDNQPALPDRLALIHGDFHPVNLMFHEGEISGVIDWSNAALGDPAFDVAITRFILVRGPAEAAGAARVGLELIRRMIARRYVRRYRKLHAVAPASLDYYEAARITMALVSAAEKRAGATTSDPYAWDLPGMSETLRGRFRQLTGVAIT